jgi:cytochrome c oxidase cbb3-type subunit 3
MKRLALLLVMALAVPAAAQRGAPANPFQGNVAAVEQGKAAYDRACTACHGINGGSSERAPAIVLSGATALRGERSDAQILAIIRNGVPGTGMPGWTGRLSDDDILRIGAYIHSLRGTAIDTPLPGDAAHGEQVFWGKGACGSCHMIKGRGGVIGPDLTNLAFIRKAVAINDALTRAQHRVYGDGGVHLPMLPTMEYEPVHVVTARGQALDGVMINRDAYSVQMMGLDGKLHLFDRAEIRSLTIKPGSVMPSDYDKRLTAEEFRDLMAFLTRQSLLRPAAAAVAGRGDGE